LMYIPEDMDESLSSAAQEEIGLVVDELVVRPTGQTSESGRMGLLEHDEARSLRALVYALSAARGVL
jgi:hypothetical protein